MIISVEELRKYITTDLDDSVLEAKLQAIESMVRKRTNNTFTMRNYRFRCQIIAQKIFIKLGDIPGLLNVGDTVQITSSMYNDGVYTIKSIEDDSIIELDKLLIDESEVVIAKVVYPADVKMGVVELMKWDLETGAKAKAGIQSETISRHSVTYVDTSSDSFYMGYPKSKLGFLTHYMKARF